MEIGKSETVDVGGQKIFLNVYVPPPRLIIRSARRPVSTGRLATYRGRAVCPKQTTATACECAAPLFRISGQA